MKRRILTALIFLLLGAIVNVAVAWGFGLSRVRSAQSAVPTKGEYLRWWRDTAPPDYEFVDEMRMFDLLEGLGHETLQWPQSPLASVSGHIVQRERLGWPYLALERSAWFDYQGVRRNVHLHTWRVPLINDRRERDLLALRPLWPGFALNILFYAAILWLLSFTLFALRRRRRIKRGLCPACAYPVGASDHCTECGRPVPSPRGS